MKVKELMRLLERENPESEIVLQRDAEGNGYSPLSQVDGNAVYISENTWSGKIYDLSWSADDACMTEQEWEEVNSRPRCVVLAPVN